MVGRKNKKEGNLGSRENERKGEGDARGQAAG